MTNFQAFHLLSQCRQLLFQIIIVTVVLIEMIEELRQLQFDQRNDGRRNTEIIQEIKKEIIQSFALRLFGRVRIDVKSLAVSTAIIMEVLVFIEISKHIMLAIDAFYMPI
ncbi:MULTISPECIES: hypothetical protein [Chitinophaga]|uniref:hypothetical protein n=1 Tax=Chitinophaga TaxID=79328 RepID=UPI0012FD2495|nr:MULTISPECIES: hypothetical protein [Chitinophaga]